MKKFKKISAVGAAVLIAGALSVTGFAAYYSTPAETLAVLTDKSVESVVAEKNESGKTYGAIANEAGKLAEFKPAMLEMKKAALQERVASGTMTQERATAIIAALEQNQENCDGTGSARIGQSMGAGFGGGTGNGQGKGNGGAGLGQGARSGAR